MPTPTNLHAAMPIPTAPLVDPQTGVVSPIWFRWFLALFNRTGGGTGVSTAGVQTNAHAAEIGMLSDAPEPVRAPPFVLDAVMADPPPARPGDALLAAVLDDDAPRPINPFLAAMIMGDAT